jgi:predicted transcriptional regulator
MPRRKGKPISFDAMVKFFMQKYSIPTKKDVDQLMARLDRLESLINNLAMGPFSAKAQIGRRKASLMAVDIVLDTIRNSKEGIGFTQIQAKTGFDEKKIRNIIFRLHKTGKIKRKSRGIYIVA